MRLFQWVPLSDLEDGLQATRLQLLREEGVLLTGIWLWSENRDPVKSVSRFAGSVGTIELQVPGEEFPEREILYRLVQFRNEFGKPVALTPVIAREPAEEKYHPRTRFGYLSNELEALDPHLGEHDVCLYLVR